MPNAKLHSYARILNNTVIHKDKFMKRYRKHKNAPILRCVSPIDVWIYQGGISTTKNTSYVTEGRIFLESSRWPGGAGKEGFNGPFPTMPGPPGWLS